MSVLRAHQPNLQRVAAQSQVLGIKRLAGHVTDGGFVRQITRRQGPNHRRCDHVLGTAQRLQEQIPDQCLAIVHRSPQIIERLEFGGQSFQYLVICSVLIVSPHEQALGLRRPGRSRRDSAVGEARIGDDLLVIHHQPDGGGDCRDVHLPPFGHLVEDTATREIPWERDRHQDLSRGEDRLPVTGEKLRQWHHALPGERGQRNRRIKR